MSETKRISPLLDGFAVGTTISEHDGVRCCPAIKENSDTKYILKIISIPASQTQMDALLLAGAYKDPEQAMVYYKELSEDVMHEAQFLREVSRLEGFESYEDWQMEPITRHRLGYEVYLIGTYKRSLEKHVRRNPMTHLEAVNLGLDLCAALSICRQAGAIYADLKPSNIFVTEKKEYKIGDLGFIPLDALSYTALPSKYRSRYSPAELEDPMVPLNLTMDTYAVGMILYQLYNEGALPAVNGDEPTAAPMHADYELAEIILKAIHPDPEQRWQDPKAMGQALAGYMQRNVVNDVPITPYTPIDTEAQDVRIPQEESPGEETPAQDVPEAEAAPQEAAEEETPAEVSESEETAATDAPETTDASVTEAPEEEAPAEPSAEEDMSADEAEQPEEPAEEPDNTEVPPQPVPEPEDEMSKIMARADDLIAHKTPDGVVIPEIPDAPDPFAFATEDSDEAMDLSIPIDPIMDPEPEKEAAKRRKKKRFLSSERRRKVRKFFSFLFTLVFLGLLACGGYWYYQNQYLQTIDSIRIEGDTNSLTVFVDSQADLEKVTVICSDPYGNSKTKELTDGAAVFSSLIPNTMYRIELEVDGFHSLIGQTSDIFTTNTTTEIISFSAVTGTNDGTALLSFTVDGDEPREWSVRYSADGEEEKAKTFLGHTVTIDGLTIGKVYTFTLQAGEGLSLSGETSVEFMASRIILAENLVASTTNGTDMTIRWSAPGDIIVDSWQVRCYSQSGYEESLSVSDTSVYLTAIDPSFSYTIEVTAAGMTQPARTSITANPINITDLKVDDSSADSLTVSWDYAGAEPEGGWLVMYTIDGSSNLNVLRCSKASATISPKIPDADYQFTIQAADGTSIFSNVHTYTCPEAPGYDHNSIKAENITAYLLKTPEDANWNYDKVGRDEFTDQFTLGDKISVVLHGNVDFYLPGTELNILYVVRDTYGNALPDYLMEGHDYWKQIWNGGNTHYGELDLPSAPDTAGSYILRIYFNGEFIAEAPFTINE